MGWARSTVVLSTFAAMGFGTGLPASSAEPFQYKGVPLGASEKALKAAHPQFTCGDSDSGGDRSCVIRGGTYAGVPAKGATANLIGDKLYSVFVLLPFERFPAVKEALTEAFGAPTTSHDTPLAAHERPERWDPRKKHYVYEWTRGPARIRMDSYAGSYPQAGALSSVVIETDAYKDELVRAEARRKKKRAKDL